MRILLIFSLLVVSYGSQLSSSVHHTSGNKKVLNIRGGSSEEISQIDWRYFLAGGICAACSHGITTPIGSN
jgi:hypothetical protein